MLTRLKELIYKIPVLRSMKVYIFLLMLIMGILPSIFMRIGILQSYEERAVDLRTSDTQTQFKIRKPSSEQQLSSGHLLRSDQCGAGTDVQSV